MMPAACPAQAQRRAPRDSADRSSRNAAAEQKPPAQERQHPLPAQNAAPRKQGEASGNIPSDWAGRLRQMSPEEQDRFLRNNERFQNLPPQQQAQIRERLRSWNGMNPNEREALRDRQRIWEQLSPQQRDYVRRDLLPKWQQMPEERRQVLLSRMRVLGSTNPADRAAKLNDPNFMRGLSPDEQDMLRNLSALRGGTGGGPPPPGSTR